jgi:hypothetical protein
VKEGRTMMMRLGRKEGRKEAKHALLGACFVHTPLPFLETHGVLLEVIVILFSCLIITAS